MDLFGLKKVKKLMDKNLKNYTALDKYFNGNKEVTKDDAAKAWESLKEIQTKMATFGMKSKMR